MCSLGGKEVTKAGRTLHAMIAKVERHIEEYRIKLLGLSGKAPR